MKLFCFASNLSAYLQNCDRLWGMKQLHKNLIGMKVAHVCWMSLFTWTQQIFFSFSVSVYFIFPWCILQRWIYIIIPLIPRVWCGFVVCFWSFLFLSVNMAPGRRSFDPIVIPHSSFWVLLLKTKTKKSSKMIWGNKLFHLCDRVLWVKWKYTQQDKLNRSAAVKKKKGYKSQSIHDRSVSLALGSMRNIRLLLMMTFYVSGSVTSAADESSGNQSRHFSELWFLLIRNRTAQFYTSSLYVLEGVQELLQKLWSGFWHQLMSSTLEQQVSISSNTRHLRPRFYYLKPSFMKDL